MGDSDKIIIEIPVTLSENPQIIDKLPDALSNSLFLCRLPLRNSNFELIWDNFCSNRLNRYFKELIIPPDTSCESATLFEPQPNIPRGTVFLVGTKKDIHLPEDPAEIYVNLLIKKIYQIISKHYFKSSLSKKNDLEEIGNEDDVYEQEQL